MKTMFEILVVFAVCAGGWPSRAANPITITAGKSAVIETQQDVQRVSIADSGVAEAVGVSVREVLVNGKSPGETTLIIWRKTSGRVVYDIEVLPNRHLLDRQQLEKIAAVRGQLRRELGTGVTFDFENNTVFLRGTATDLPRAERAAAIAGSLGKVVNLLRVNVPDAEPQILLKVKFANVDRTAIQELGANFFSTGAGNTPGQISTQQFSPPKPELVQGKTATFTLTDALNVFLFRADLNLGATIKALQNRSLLEVLAEPNVLARNGKKASFLAGGEFPYPVVQGAGSGLTTVTIQFREFGIRLNFRPTISPRGTIRLEVEPEVSSLNFANGLVFQGFTVPAITVRRVNTEIELENGQGFAIAGLLDNRATETLSKVPGLGDIPLLGKLFQSRSLTKNKSELLVMVTPELVRPIPAGQTLPSLDMPVPFMKQGGQNPPRTPGADATGAVPPPPKQGTVPVQQLLEEQKRAGEPAVQPMFQLVPALPGQALPGAKPQEVK